MKIESWIKKRWAVMVAVFLLLLTWAAVVWFQQGLQKNTGNLDARLQAILQAKALLLGRMDEAERAKDKQAYMQLLKAYIEKQNEYDKVLPGLPGHAGVSSKTVLTGFTDSEKLEMLALEHKISTDDLKKLRAEIEIMFRESTAAEDEALGKFLKSK